MITQPRAGEDCSQLIDALGTLSRYRSDENLRDLLIGAIGHDDQPDALAALSDWLGVDPAASASTLQKEFLDSLDHEQLKSAAARLVEDGGNPAKFTGTPLTRAFSVNDVSEAWGSLRSAFLTNTGSVRAKFVNKKTDEAAPWIAPLLSDTAESVLELQDRLHAITIYHDTSAFLSLTRAIADQYREEKAARTVLDFEDLIFVTRRLLHDVDAVWVRYKLDQGVDHFLVDEAQDTSPQQWEIIDALIAEITGGDGARDEDRTFFAVGDIKQSIYSFQGADAELVSAKMIQLGEQLSVVGPYIAPQLDLSFRTSEPVLAFVDAVFTGEAADGLGELPLPVHQSNRAQCDGAVTLWPLTPRLGDGSIDPWDAPVDRPAADDPASALATKIATTIQSWVGKEMLPAKGRFIEPGDVMILVQSRGRLFNEIIRCLGRAGVAVAGADRLRLDEDAAVQDLLSYMRWAVAPHDDLSLAEVLKSPLFGFDDDGDLFPLCFHRATGESLWEALRARAGEKENWASAIEPLQTAMAIGRDKGPFDFLTTILETGAPSGRQRFYRRLSEAARETIDELLNQALNFEAAQTRSLTGFLQMMEEAGTEIKREMEGVSDAVRVMTVHGAKGLESPIVFIADGHRTPSVSKLGPVYKPGAPGVPPVFVGKTAQHISQTDEARKTEIAKTYEEYRRQFYVALTRAEDRLIICGVEQGNVKDPTAKPVLEQCWWALADAAMGRLEARVIETPSLWTDHDTPKDTPVRRIEFIQQDVEEQPREAVPDFVMATPDWLEKPAPGVGVSPVRTSPSRQGELPAVSPRQQSVHRRGTVLHRLLELLPQIPPAERSTKGIALVGALAADTSVDEREAWVNEAITIIDDERFAPVFGSQSRSEVSIAGTINLAGTNVDVSGRIDRLAVLEREIFVVDYKTNRPPPDRVESVPLSYCSQLALYRALLQKIYPGFKVSCAFIWTYNAELMVIPDDLLDASLKDGVFSG